MYTSTATTALYTLSLHDALPISARLSSPATRCARKSWRYRHLNCASPAAKACCASWWWVAARLRGRKRSSRSEEHTSELQSQFHLVCRLLLEKKKIHRSVYHVHT